MSTEISIHVIGGSPKSSISIQILASYWGPSMETTMYFSIRTKSLELRGSKQTSLLGRAVGLRNPMIILCKYNVSICIYIYICMYIYLKNRIRIGIHFFSLDGMFTSHLIWWSSGRVKETDWANLSDMSQSRALSSCMSNSGLWCHQLHGRLENHRTQWRW